MTNWNSLYLSHIGRVRATYSLSSPNLEPDEISQLLSLEPSFTCRRGDAKLNNKGERMPTDEKEGTWLISSDGLDSKDLNAHIESLLVKLLPHEAVFLTIRIKGRTVIRVCASSSLFMYSMSRRLYTV